jgi:hypothetical protein
MTIFFFCLVLLTVSSAVQCCVFIYDNFVFLLGNFLLFECVRYILLRGYLLLSGVSSVYPAARILTDV